MAMRNGDVTQVIGNCGSCHWVGGYMGGWMGVWVNGQMADQYVHEWVDVCMDDGWKDGCLDGWMLRDEQIMVMKKGLINEWMVG